MNNNCSYITSIIIEKGEAAHAAKSKNYERHDHKRGHFSTIDAMKRAAYGQVDHLRSEYMMTMKPEQDPILGIGLNYIRFAVISVACCLYLAKRVETPAIHRAEPRQEPAPNTGKA